MPWTAEMDPGDTWLTITGGSSGTNNGTITINFDSNSGPDRMALLTVTAPNAENSPQTVEVRQGSPTLSVSPDYLNVSAYSGTTTFTIENLSGGTMNWTISTDSPWITDIIPSSGTNNATITVSYETNDSDERIGPITVTADGAVD